MLRLERMLDDALKDPQLELEIRLGVAKTTHFVAQVSRDHMHNLMRAIELADAGNEWTETVDYFYVAKGARVRTRVVCDSDNMRLTPTTIRKTVVDSVVLKSRVMDVRIALSREVNVSPSSTAVTTDHVRIKQVRRYESPLTPFVVECSAVWSGRTLTDAETAQNTTDPSFEVECEFVGSRAEPWVRKHKGKTRLMVTSVLYKAAAIMLSSGVCFEEERNEGNGTCR